jgi:hypothetical protein
MCQLSTHVMPHRATVHFLEIPNIEIIHWNLIDHRLTVVRNNYSSLKKPALPEATVNAVTECLCPKSHPSSLFEV